MARGRQRHQGRSQRKGAQQQSRAGADKDSQVGIQDQVGHRQQQQLPEHEQQDIIDTFLARLQQLHIGDHSDEDDKKQCQYFDISDDSRAAVQCMEVSDEAEGEKLETGPVILPQTGDSDIGEEGGEEAEAEQLYSGFQAVQSMVGDRDEAEGEQLEAGLLFPAMRSRTPEEAEVVEQLYSGIQAVHEGDTEDECERTDEAVTSTGSPSSSHNSADLYIGVGTEEGNKGETECEWTDEADTSTSSPSSSRIGAKSCARLADDPERFITDSGFRKEIFHEDEHSDQHLEKARQTEEAQAEAMAEVAEKTRKEAEAAIAKVVTGQAGYEESLCIMRGLDLVVERTLMLAEQVINRG